MDRKNRLLSDELLHKALKVLGVILLFLGVLYMASQFSTLWQTILSSIRNAIILVGLAWLISLVIYPMIRMLERRGVGPRGLSVGIVYLGTFVLIGFGIYFLWPFLIGQIRDFFATDVPQLQEYFQSEFRTDFILGTETYDWFATAISDSNVIENTIDALFGTLSTSVLPAMAGFITIMLILPVFLAYYLHDYEIVNDSIRSLIPRRYAKGASVLGTRLNHTVGAYIRGQLILMIAIFTVATIIYTLIVLKYFFVL